MASNAATLAVWVVYDNPTDHPGFFVARKWLLDKPTNVLLRARHLDDLRMMLPPDLYRMDRYPEDDPKIVETWLTRPGSPNMSRQPQSARFEAMNAANTSDRADALRAAEESLSYDQWLKAKVQESIDDPADSVSDERVRKHFEAKRAALRQQL